MRISDLIRELKVIKAREGDLPVRWESVSHTLVPDPVVRTLAGKKLVVLNS